jgi:hypothetical protein
MGSTKNAIPTKSLVFLFAHGAVIIMRTAMGFTSSAGTPGTTNRETREAEGRCRGGWDGIVVTACAEVIVVTEFAVICEVCSVLLASLAGMRAFRTASTLAQFAHVQAEQRHNCKNLIS